MSILQDYLVSSKEIVLSVSAYLYQKVIFSLPLGSISMFLLGQDGDKILYTLTFLVVFDFFTGIGAAYKVGEPIESRKCFKSALKLVLYLLLVAAGGMVDGVVPGTYLVAQNTVLAFLAITEFISILENTGRMGYAVPQKLLNRLVEFREAK